MEKNQIYVAPQMKIVSVMITLTLTATLVVMELLTGYNYQWINNNCSVQ
jgi:hypothetical protein